MESGNNGNQESYEDFFLKADIYIFFGNQKTSENKDFLIKNNINHILLIGNELKALFKEVKIH